MLLPLDSLRYMLFRRLEFQCFRIAVEVLYHEFQFWESACESDAVLATPTSHVDNLGVGGQAGEVVELFDLYPVRCVGKAGCHGYVKTRATVPVCCRIPLVEWFVSCSNRSRACISVRPSGMIAEFILTLESKTEGLSCRLLGYLPIVVPQALSKICCSSVALIDP